MYRIALLALAVAGAAAQPAQVTVRLSEWNVQLSEQTVADGSVTFAVTNAGSIPHAFEIEGHGIEKETPTIQPGGKANVMSSTRRLSP